MKTLDDFDPKDMSWKTIISGALIIVGWFFMKLANKIDYEYSMAFWDHWAKQGEKEGLWLYSQRD